MLHTLTVRSLDAVTSSLPSGEKLQCVTYLWVGGGAGGREEGE